MAVKIIDKKQAHQDKYVARNMRREAKIMQMIRHPNIVQLLEVVETEHRLVIFVTRKVNFILTKICRFGWLLLFILLF